MIPHRILCPDIAQELTMEKQRKVLIGTPTYDDARPVPYAVTVHDEGSEAR